MIKILLTVIIINGAFAVLLVLGMFINSFVLWQSLFDVVDIEDFKSWTFVRIMLIINLYIGVVLYYAQKATI